jgi:acyl-CoA thioesterase FadM
VDRFEEEVLVRWTHTNPAGVVFYPRYFEMTNALVEYWFAGPLGCDFETLHGELGTGVPTVSIECEYARPSRLGDRLVFELVVERMGGGQLCPEGSCERPQRRATYEGPAGTGVHRPRDRPCSADTGRDPLPGGRVRTAPDSVTLRRPARYCA